MVLSRPPLTPSGQEHCSTTCRHATLTAAGPTMTKRHVSSQARNKQLVEYDFLTSADPKKHSLQIPLGNLNAYFHLSPLERPCWARFKPSESMGNCSPKPSESIEIAFPPPHSCRKKGQVILPLASQPEATALPTSLMAS